MNERIRELAKQARQIGEYGNYGQIQLSTQQFEQKFAELIVRECIAVINSENYREHSEGWNSAIEWADGMIKEHFGVEE